jgi:perosamine synthetase
VSSQGAYVEQVTRDFPGMVGARFGVPCSNGTAALHLAMLALGVFPGDEVIVPNLTYVATANAPLFVGAAPVLADVRESDLAIDPDRVDELITARTRGVIAVHLYGIVADLTRLRALCDQRGLWLVEDCAEVLGAPADTSSRPGGWGELATWSFYGNKVLTCGEGGFVTARVRDDLIARAVSFRGQAVDPTRRYWHRHLGFNFRLTNLQCAVLSGQMESLERLRGAREVVRALYDDALRPGIERGDLLALPTPDICWMYSARLPEAESTARRDTVLSELERHHGIETRPFFPPMDEQPHLRGMRKGSCVVSHRLSRAAFNLPTHPAMTPAEVSEISTALLGLVEGGARER